MTLRIFDTQREEWVDLDARHGKREASRLPSLPHSCGDCGAHFRQGEELGACEHRRLCGAGWAGRVPVKDADGNTVRMLGNPDPVKLARHVQVYGPEGAEPWLHLLDGSRGKTVNAVISRRSRRSSTARMVKPRNWQKFVANTA